MIRSRTVILFIALELCRGQSLRLEPFRLSSADIQQIRDAMPVVEARLKKLRATEDQYNDIAIYLHAAEWILRHPEEFYSQDYVENTREALRAAMRRMDQLEGGMAQWLWEAGRVPLAYRSRVDGSLQPFILHIPRGYEARPMRLDIWLHGRSANMNEVSFLAGPKKPRPETQKPYFVLEVYGRTNNAYRWAGETDVFEALNAVRRRFKIRAGEIALRGFSMGGAGAWHIGLHYPAEWAAVEAGAGFNETRRYAKLGEIPPWQEPLLNIYDAYKYAANAFNVPVIGYGGELDPQLQASRNVQAQLAEEKLPNLRTLFLVGPKTEHRWHPESQKEADAFIDAQIRERRPRDRIQFITYTTRYNQCDWLTIDAIEKHYERTEVDASRSGEVRTRNVARLTMPGARDLVIDGQKVSGDSSFEKRDGKWRRARADNQLRKRHGLQGPIDDAFMDPFLTADPPEKFRAEWAKWMRGNLRVKALSEIGKEDMSQYNLVLFGEPSNNSLIAKISPKLPVRWEKDQIAVGARRFSAAEHTLALIYPNPLAPSRYVVINSGHTFGEREFRGTNALLFPRLGDYAVIRKSDGAVVAGGLFDERWQLADK